MRSLAPNLGLNAMREKADEKINLLPTQLSHSPKLLSDFFKCNFYLLLTPQTFYRIGVGGSHSLHPHRQERQQGHGQPGQQRERQERPGPQFDAVGKPLQPPVKEIPGNRRGDQQGQRHQPDEIPGQ